MILKKVELTDLIQYIYCKIYNKVRTRVWRREIERLIVMKRLRLSKNYNTFININGDKSQHPALIDYIGTKYNFMYKTYKTAIWNSRNKIKYSPNKGSVYYRSFDKNGTREGNKVIFFKILKEYGIR